MLQRSGKNGPNTQPPAGNQIHEKIRFCILAHDHVTGADTVGRDPRVGLQAHTYFGRRSTGTGSTDDLTSAAKSHSSPGGAGQRLCSFRDDVDGRLKLKPAGANFYLCRNSTPSSVAHMASRGCEG